LVLSLYIQRALTQSRTSFEAFAKILCEDPI
jgi:hypothetical protein